MFSAKGNADSFGKEQTHHTAGGTRGKDPTVTRQNAGNCEAFYQFHTVGGGGGGWGLASSAPYMGLIPVWP